jgi:ABC-type polysaccharide/polyol phosphate transport system ATPase subunit
MSEPVISIENISKSYQLGVIGTGTFRDDMQRWWAKLRGLPDPILKIGEKKHREGETIWALKDVSFQVQQGEAVGIIGRNGAGKSTLLKILARITAPTSGNVKVKGRIGSLLEVGTGFHPELTGRQNIFLNGAIMGMSRAEVERKFDEIVDFSGVEKFIDTPVKRYSSGMYVRLAFAVAAHLEPDILIVDEVLAVGDVEFQKKCLGKMDEVTQGGRTILFVSHNMNSIQQLCSQAVVLNSGKVDMIGPMINAIGHYMKVTKYQQGERVWDTPDQPGNDIVRLVAMRVKDQGRKIAAEFDVRTPFEIEVDYRVLREGYQICAVLELLSFGTIIAVVFDDYIQQPWGQQPPRCPGTFRAIFRVPGDLFNEGQVSINLRIFSPPEQPNSNPHVRLFDVIQFMIKDRMDPGGVRGSFPHNWGVPAIRPRLESRTEQISDAISDPY